MRSDCQIFTYILIVWSLVFLIVAFKMVESFICVFACIITCNYTCNLWKNTTAFSFVIFAGPLHAYTQKTNIVINFDLCWSVAFVCCGLILRFYAWFQCCCFSCWKVLDPRLHFFSGKKLCSPTKVFPFISIWSFNNFQFQYTDAKNVWIFFFTAFSWGLWRPIVFFYASLWDSIFIWRCRSWGRFTFGV